MTRLNKKDNIFIDRRAEDSRVTVSMHTARTQQQGECFGAIIVEKDVSGKINLALLDCVLDGVHYSRIDVVCGAIAFSFDVQYVRATADPKAVKLTEEFYVQLSEKVFVRVLVNSARYPISILSNK